MDVLQRLRRQRILGQLSYDPDTRFIRKIQETIDNPFFNLSIADYEIMCKNKMMTKMMSKALKCDEKQLKEFCKYINYFKDHMPSDTSRYYKTDQLSKLLQVGHENPRRSINATMRRESLRDLPDDMLRLIVNEYKTLLYNN